MSIAASSSIVIALFIILLVLKFPIYIAILIPSLFLQVFVNGMSPANIIVGMYEGIARNSLLAIPFFLFAGSIMGNTSLGKRLMDLFDVMLQPFRAGLALGCLTANAFFGAISGSSAATTATFLKIAHTPLKERYDDKLATGLITTASSLSIILPPSIGMILFAMAAEISVTELFLTGIGPAALIVFIIWSYLSFRYRKMPKRPRPKAADVFKVSIRAIPILVLPIIIFGGIYSGFFTPTEAAAVSVAYALICGVFFLKDINGKQLIKILKEATKISSQVFMIVAAGTVFAQAITIAQYHVAIVNVLSNVGIVGFLIILNVLLLFFGSFLDGASKILILTPLVLPSAMALGIDPFHIGILFIINIGISTFTPPFGLDIFVAQSVLGVSVGRVTRSVFPFLICYLLLLLLVTFVPQIALFLI